MPTRVRCILQWPAMNNFILFINSNNKFNKINENYKILIYL